MYLLAQSEILTSTTGQQSLTIIGLMLCVVQSILGWATNRDRLRFDMQKNDLVHEVKSLTERANECANDRAKLNDRLHELEIQLASLVQERPQ